MNTMELQLKGQKMRIGNIDAVFLHEEKRALNIYLFTFYITLVLYDFFYYFLYKKYILKITPGFDHILGYTNYLVYIGLLFISILLLRLEKVSLIKYLYVGSYLLLTTLYDCIVFIHDPKNYVSGNAAELIIVILSPLFINKRFYWFTSLGIIGRYITVGTVIHSSIVFIPIVLIVILGVISYILLNRFSSYTDSLTKTYEELRNKEKLAFVGQMATAIGHEIRNPLSSLKGFTQLQREKYPEDEAYFLIMEQEIDRINSIMNDLLLLGKPRPAQFAKHNLKDIIEYVVSITQQLANQKNTTIHVSVEEDLSLVECDENQIKQVFINLIKNGIEAMSNGGQVDIKASNHSANSVVVNVVDQGCGISKEQQENLFEPFYTTKDDGTGLGLMVTRKIIEDHHGEIKIDSEVNKGTKIQVILPVKQLKA